MTTDYYRILFYENKKQKKRANPLLPALFLVNIYSSDYCYATRSYIPSDLL